MRQFELEFSPNAREEILEANEYYLNKAGLNVAVKFENELKYSFQQIKLNPYNQSKNSKYRFFPMRKFPYVIIYSLLQTEGLIRVLSIFHTSQNPEKYP